MDNFLAQYPRLATWVSCREQDYPPDRALRLDRVTVTPLDPVRVQEFIHNYLDALPDFGQPDTDDLFWQLAGKLARETYEKFMAQVGEKLVEPFRTFWLDDNLPGRLAWGVSWSKNLYWKEWLKARAQPASLLQLATNPYMLFMLLQVYQDKRVVPANRGQLFDWFVERLLLREHLFNWDPAVQKVVRQPAGEALLAGLTELAYEMQRRREDSVALTALPLAETETILDERQRYQAASANLLSLGTDVRFAHQLLQEYFVACAMRARIFPVAAAETPVLRASDIWPARRWWETTNWEESVILLAGLYSDDCTPVLRWVVRDNPEVASRCIVESGAYTPDKTKQRLRDTWLPHLTMRRNSNARARAAVGRALGRLVYADGLPLDDRPGVGFVWQDDYKIPDIAWGKEVPSGQYMIGGDKETHSSFERRTVTIPYPYRLACYPVTCAQFDCFVTAPDFANPRWWEGMPKNQDQIKPSNFWHYTNHPRENVSWYQAIAFCRWLSYHLGTDVTLPDEYEWETAARWPDGRFYPWGNKFDPDKTNTSEGKLIGQPTAVGIYPHGANQTLNLYDLIGNVWEWCRNKYDRPHDNQIDDSEDRRVLRGGSWNFNSNRTRATYRYPIAPARYNFFTGFRLVRVRRPPSH